MLGWKKRVLKTKKPPQLQTMCQEKVGTASGHWSVTLQPALHLGKVHRLQFHII